MNTVILKVKPNSRFHFGKVSLDVNTGLQNTDTFIHSDMLFSALINNASQVVETQKLELFIKSFEEGMINISSGIYCIETSDNEYIYLVPRPITAQNILNNNKYESIKQIKKIQFISQKVLENIHVNEWFDQDKCRKIGNVIVTKDEYGKVSKLPFLYAKDVSPHINIHKTNEDSSLYNIGAIQIVDSQQDFPKVHFYFQYKANVDDDIQKLLNLSIDLLKVNGIGGERSSGFGAIEKVDLTQQMKYNIDSSTWMNTSLFIPNENELESILYYNYKTRGGRKTDSDGKLDFVRMICEGSIFKREDLKGKTVDLHSSGKYKRNGNAFLINIPDYYGNES